MVEPSSNTPPPEDPLRGPPFVDEPSDDDTNLCRQPAPTGSSHHSSKSTSNQWFTFDDLPKTKWPARFKEFTA